MDANRLLRLADEIERIAQGMDDSMCEVGGDPNADDLRDVASELRREAYVGIAREAA